MLPIDPPFTALNLDPASKGDRTKMSIVVATIECIAELGYERTNYETIGQKCNLERPHVLYHFPDKEILFSQSVRYVYAVGARLVSESMSKGSGTWNSDLSNYIRATFAWMSADHRFPAVLCLAFYLSSIDARYKTMMTDVRLAGESRVLSIISKHPNKFGKAKANSLTRIVHGLIFNECLKYLTCSQSKVETARSFQKEIENLVNAMVSDDA